MSQVPNLRRSPLPSNSCLLVFTVDLYLEPICLSLGATPGRYHLLSTCLGVFPDTSLIDAANLLRATVRETQAPFAPTSVAVDLHNTATAMPQWCLGFDGYLDIIRHIDIPVKAFVF